MLSLGAADVVNDPFTDNNRSGGSDPLGAVWYQSTTNSGQVTIVDDSAGIGSGNAMQLVPSLDFHKLLAFFPATTLAGVGDTIRATFDYRFPTAPTSVGSGFRIGLGNSGGTKQTIDEGGSTRGNDKNYGFDTNVGSTSSVGTAVRYEDAGDDILGGSGAGVRVGFGTSGGSVASGTTKHSASLQITRMAGGDLFVQAQIDSLPAASGTHAAPGLTYTFDEFAFGFGGTGYRPTIRVDNVVVTSTAVNVLNISATDPNGSKATADPAAFTVTRSNSVGALSVPYTVGGTATSGVDYQPLSGTVNFANGQSSATITVTPITGAAFADGSETVIVTLTQPGGTLLQASTATVTFTDAFSVLSGQIEPEFSELYTFYVTADGVRLWIDDRLVVARTILQNGEVRGQARLTAGQRVNYRVESIGTTSLSLEWSSPSRSRQVIPQSRIFANRADKAGGSILKEHWSGIAGPAISALTSSANFPNKPSGRELLTSFECLAQDWADSYGTRVTGFIVPPATGNYTFAVSGDDTAELYLSPDEIAGNKALIASVSSATAFRQWNAQPSQQSAGIALVQGRRYYVELLHKEGSGTDHWSVGWKKPGDVAFGVVTGSALVQSGLDRTQPAQANFLDTLAQDHPRLFATPERFAWLKAVYLNPATSKPKTWATSAITSANTILGQAPVAYTQDARGTILGVARTAKDRMYYLGLAWWLTGNDNYAERAWTELDVLADNTAFPDWDPAHFLDVAEMTHACAIGYDWFYQYWTPSRRDTIRTAIINKGLNAGMAQYTAHGGSWPNNWNQVCNGGISIGALAVGTESETLVEDILTRAMNSLRPVMGHYTTDDGAWYEGPGYWTYSTEYLVRHLAGLEWALGSDFGLSGTRLFSESGLYPLAMSGPLGTPFYHSDSGSGRITEDAMQWHARRFNQPLCAWYENTYGSGVLDALWWSDQPTSVTAAGFSPDIAFHGESGTPFKPVEVVTMRTNWSDSRATFLGAKGGWMGAEHGDLDAGTFVVDALGKRWFHELGPDDYGLPGYFSNTPNAGGDDRWDYYRTRAEGQNTILVDPGAGPDMAYGTVSPLLAYQSAPGGRRSLAVFDLTPSTSGVTRLWRGFQIMGNRNQVLVQDEISAPAGRTVWWFAHYTHPATGVVIDPDGSAATLTQGAERLWVKIVSGGGTFQIMDATPLPASPNPAGQNANTGYRKLAIQLTGVSNTTFAVWMVPLATGENPPVTLPAITPLNTWNLAAGNDAPVTPGGAVTTIADQSGDIDLWNFATDDATYPNALTFGVSGAVNGTVSLLGDGHTARFTPAAGYTGVPAFNYAATDEGGISSTGTFTISAVTTTQVWTATSNGAWSTGANWAGGVAPISSRGNTLEFFTGQTLGAGAVTANNDTGPFQINVLTLSGTSGGVANVALSGGTLTLSNNGTLNPVVNLNATSGSGLTYDVNTPVTLASPTTFQVSGNATFRFNGNVSGAGGLTKTGASTTLILAGTNNYTGGTTIAGGTLQIGNGGSTGTLPAGLVTNNTFLRLFRGDTAAIFDNPIGGTGAVQIGATGAGGGSAIVTLTGANTFSGGFTVNSGGLRIRDAAVFGAGTKTISMASGNVTGGTPNPHLRLDGSAGNIDLPATISFSVSNSATTNGAFYNEAGDNIVRGNVTLTGGNGDTYLYAAGGSLTFTGNFAPDITGRNLYLRGPGTGAITGTISNGTGINTLSSVRKEDAGTWTLGGAVTHTGTVVVNGGTLIVNGSINGPSAVTIASAAKLAGTGTIAANTTINGTHQPGAGVGVQNFTGTLSYGSASHLIWELAGNLETGAGTNFDQVTATGTVAIATTGTQPALDVTLNSAGSTVNFTDPFWGIARIWTVVSAGTRTGTFTLGTISSDSAGRAFTGFGTFSLQQTATAVALLWTPASPFQQWRAAWFGADWNNATIGGDLADPEGDGFNNLMEFAFGLNPTQASSFLLPLPLRVGGNCVMAFTQPAGVSGITYHGQWGPDLAMGNWQEVTDTGTGNVHTFSVPFGTNHRIFMRLRITSP